MRIDRQFFICIKREKEKKVTERDQEREMEKERHGPIERDLGIQRETEELTRDIEI